MKEKLLLTGSDGFTGQHFAIAAEEAGFKVECLRPNLTHANDLADEVLHIQPQYVVHLAALSFVGESDDPAFYEVNLFGTLNFLKALSLLNVKPRKILLASSANVYGNTLNSPVTENTCPKPVNHYAMSKLAMERMASSYFNQLPIIIARPFNYTGLWHDARFVIPKLINHFKSRASEIELGNLNVLREYNDVRTVCRAYLGLLQMGIPHEIYNIASGRAISLQEIISILERLTQHQINIKVDQKFIRPNEISSLSGSSAKIESILGPLKHPKIEETLAWMLGN